MLLDKTYTYEEIHSENTAATAAATSQPITSYSTDTVTSSRPSHSTVGGACHTGSDVITEVDSISERISVADLLIMQSSFDSKNIISLVHRIYSSDVASIQLVISQLPKRMDMINNY